MRLVGGNRAQHGGSGRATDLRGESKRLLRWRNLVMSVSRIGFTAKRVCMPTGQSSDSERARDQWQSAAATPQVNLSFSFVSYVSKHLI